MHNRIIFCCILTILSSVTVLAQNRVVEGFVSDRITGEALVAVTIHVEGTSRGITTDIDGRYSIEVSRGEMLIFSHIGYINQSVLIANQVTINIELEQDTEVLEELVIVAYGNQKKRAVTGAVSTINSKSIEARPISTLQVALQGAAPGISVLSSSGHPGSSSSVQIRGAGSIDAGTGPLYVVDGIPLSGSLNALNNSDIESISVLKDASASALYGSRAANGVILVTTKRGKKGKVEVNVRAQTGFSNVAVETHETLNALEYYRLYWQQYYNDNITEGQSAEEAAQLANTETIELFSSGTTHPVNPFSSDNALGPDGQLRSGVQQLYDTDWLDETINKGINSEFDLNISGGNEITRYYLSANISEQGGTLPGSDFSKGTFRMNLDTKANNFLDVSINSSISFSETLNTPDGGGANNPFRFGNITSNVYSFYARDENNEIIIDPLTGRKTYNYETPTVLDFHPVGLSELDTFLDEYQGTDNTMRLNATVAKGLQLSTTLNVQVINIKTNDFENGQHGNAVPQNTRVSQSFDRYETLMISNQLNYKADYGLNSFDLIIGQEYVSYHNEFLSAGTSNFVTEIFTELSAGTTIDNASSSYTDSRLISYFSRLNYGYNDKYFLTASVRRDGASQFGANNKWGTFGSLGASWIISEESFLEENRLIDLLKFRASYGTTGNNSIGSYSSLGLLGFSSSFDYYGEGGSTYTQLANPELKWEVNKSLDVGIEFEVFNSRLIGEVVYWTRTTDDLLFDVPIPVSSAGFSSITSNLAKMRNDGIEIALDYRIINKKDMIWSVNANISTINNEILELPVDFIQNGTKRFIEGKDRYQYFIQEFAGVDPTTGSPLWFMDEVDNDGNPTGERITTDDYSKADRYNLGSSMEDYYGGFGTSLNYKGIDFTASFYYRVGNVIYDNTKSDLMHMGADPGIQLSTEVFDAWTEDNINTDVPKFDINNADSFDSRSSRFLYKGDYLRLKSVVLGYSIDNERLSKFNIRNLRVFIVGENLLTFAAYDGLDPELPRSGNSNNIYPPMRSFSVGINLGF